MMRTRLHNTWENHLDELDRKVGSVIWQHCSLDHNSELQNFTLSVTGLYQNDCKVTVNPPPKILGTTKGMTMKF